MNYKSNVCVISGITKPNSIEQPVLIGLVLQFVQQFVPDFYASDISWVRSLKSSRFGVLNVQCRTVLAAARVRSTFASLVRAKPVPAFIGKVISQFKIDNLLSSTLSFFLKFSKLYNLLYQFQTQPNFFLQIL